MNTPQIYVAKYTPNILRMEPRNAGIVAWLPERVVAKFLGEQPDGRVIPPAIVPKESRHEYRAWISYWRIMLGKESLRDKHGHLIPRAAPEFMHAIQAKARASFMLCEAGYVRGDVTADELPELVDEYFDELVKEAAQERIREHKRALRKATTQVLQKAEVKEFGDLHPRFPVPCKIGQVTKKLLFDYAVVESDVPKAVFQRVTIPQDTSICSASFMFEKLGKSRRKHSPARCALILSEPEGEKANGAHDNLEILKQYARVIDLADPDRAAEEIRHLMAA
jgi:hypothetical protein